MVTKRAVPGIFCVEGDWYSDLTRRDSVQPLLVLLQDVAGCRYIRRDVATREELANLLTRWTEPRYAAYPIAYLAFHGSPGSIHLGRRRISLDDVGEMLAGACEGKVIYFGACGVLDIEPAAIDAFRTRTKALCVAGFNEKVYWIESAAFDLLFFEALTYFSKMRDVAAWMSREHGSFATKLGFKMYYG